MGRARLMEQQRAKIEARRAAKKKAAKTTKKVTEKVKSVGNSLTGNGAPKPSQIKVTPKKPAAKPTSKPAASKPAASKPASKPTPKPSGGGASLSSKLTEAEKKARRIAMASVKTGSATQGQNMPSNPALKSQTKKSTSKNKGASLTRKTGSNKKTATPKTNNKRRYNRRGRAI